MPHPNKPLTVKEVRESAAYKLRKKTKAKAKWAKSPYNPNRQRSSKRYRGKLSKPSARDVIKPTRADVMKDYDPLDDL